MKEHYDYVVAGVAGCVLAARLAEDRDVSVLLLEAGGPGRSPFIAMPAGNGFLFGNSRYDWGFTSVPQPGLGGRTIYYPRGKALGGSAILNGMIYVRGNRRDYELWRQRGLAGWSYAELLPYFRKAEGAAHRDDGFHGKDGPLRTSPAANHTPLDRHFQTAARATGAAWNDDFNGASQAGVGRFDVMVWRGRRQSTASTYLAHRPPNLDIATGARVLGLALQGGRAVGINVAHGGRTACVRVGREVILSLGAFGSPQALLLSGIGPADELRALGIGVALDLPGVGRNLFDHLNMPVQFACTDRGLSHARFQRLDRAVGLGLRWFATRGGPGASPFWSACLFEQFAGSDRPDLQIFFTPMVVKEARDVDDWDQPGLLDRLGRKIFVRGSKTAVAGFQFDINLMHPEGSGTVKLASTDPRAQPLIDPRFLTGERERRDLLRGIERVRAIAATAPLAAVTGPELSPGAAVKDEASLTDAMRRLANTAHHPVGTCRMGIATDVTAVVDESLSVRGIAGLRVCDASVFPDQITGNPTAAIVAIAEKAADMIRGRQPLAAASV